MLFIDNESGATTGSFEILHTMADDYVFGTILGQGAYGCAVRAQRKATKEVVAVKIIPKASLINLHGKRAERITLEMNVQAALHKSPFYPQLYAAFQCPQHAMIAMEYVHGETLTSALRRQHQIGTRQTQVFAAQLLLALEDIHAQRVIHRDIKLENFMISSRGYIKVLDLGLAIPFPDETFAGVRIERDRFRKAGSTSYMAPEIFKQSLEKKGGYDHRIDIWSLGICIFEMLAGYRPFKSFVPGKDNEVSDDPNLVISSNISNFLGSDRFSSARFGSMRGTGDFSNRAIVPLTPVALAEAKEKKKSTKPKCENTEMIRRLSKPVDYPSGMDEEAKDLIMRMLHVDPIQRWSIPELKQHDFFKEVNWEDLRAGAAGDPRRSSIVSDDSYKGRTRSTVPVKWRSFNSVLTEVHRGQENLKFWGEKIQEERQDLFRNWVYEAGKNTSFQPPQHRTFFSRFTSCGGSKSKTIGPT